MGKASSAKKVARAARSGGGRRAGQQRNWLFPGSVAVIVVLGVLLIAVARNQDAAEADVPPLLTDHWHAAFGINICGEWQQPLADGPEDRYGIHTHDDGVIHVHPFTSGATGDGAKIDKFFDQVGLEVSDDKIAFPGSGDEYEAGEDKCGEADATVRLLRWDSPQDEEPEIRTAGVTEARFQADREVFALVFAAEDAEIGQPPTVPNLDQLTDVPPTDPFAADPTVPSDDGSTTTIPLEGAEGEEGEDGSTTSAPADEGEGEGEGEGDATTTSSPATSAPEDEQSTTSSSAP